MIQTCQWTSKELVVGNDNPSIQSDRYAFNLIQFEELNAKKDELEDEDNHF